MAKPLIKGIKLNWWQTGIFKITLISAGILLGLFFYSILVSYMLLFIILMLSGGAYITWLWLNQ